MSQSKNRQEYTKTISKHTVQFFFMLKKIGLFDRPLVSIITPVLNNEADLEDCIRSVAEQTYSNKEHIFIDGVSADNSVRIISEYAQIYPHIRLYSEKDDGIYDAMNKGIRLSTGEWIFFLGSDDVLSDSRTLDSVFSAENIGTPDIICGNVMLLHANRIFEVTLSLVQILERGIHHQSLFCRRSLFERFGNFDTRYRSQADWEFNMRWFGDSSIRRKKIDSTIAIYNEYGYSSQNDDERFKADKNDIVRRNFPFLIYCLYRAQVFSLWDIFQKAFVSLRTEGFLEFVVNIYHFVLHGREYFKNDDRS